MATLQKIRTKGSLLVIVIGLALFAFVAGDAWKILQPHQSQDVGSVNGKALSAQEYQALVEEYTDIVKMSLGVNSLDEAQSDELKDEVWRTFVNNHLLAIEAEKLGLEVTNEEILSIIDEGVHPLLQQTPFRNPQTGAFDKDVLYKVLADYKTMDRNTMPAQYVEYYESMNKYWSFIEKNLVSSRLAEKYQSLLGHSLLANTTEAEGDFQQRTLQMDLLVGAVPYSSVADSLVSVSDAEIKDLYAKNKEQYKQLVETRDIKYIDVQVLPSEEDIAAIQEEMMEYTEQLATTSDLSSFIRSTGSEVPYTDLYYTKNAFPTDVVARLDSTSIGEAFGPYFNTTDNTINSFKVLGKAALADSIQFRQIQVYSEDVEKNEALADSIYSALKAGANFQELAEKYGQSGDKNWISSQNYAGMPLEGDNYKYIKTLVNLGVNELANLKLGQAHIILQVTGKADVQSKYNIAVVKRPLEFSKETYSEIYNKFSQFIASNSTYESILENAEDAGYRVLDRKDLSSAEHGIGDIPSTKEALRWAFSAKPGEVSGLYECGDNDRMIVVGLSSINKAGYRPINKVSDMLRAELIRDKKAELISEKIKAANISTIEGISAVDGKIDTLKHVTFAAPAYLSVLNSSEPLLGGYAFNAELNKVSNPIKGNAGVFLASVLKKENQEEELDIKQEKENKESMYLRLSSRFINELYIKADVVDNRYIYF